MITLQIIEKQHYTVRRMRFKAKTFGAHEKECQPRHDDMSWLECTQMLNYRVQTPGTDHVTHGRLPVP